MDDIVIAVKTLPAKSYLSIKGNVRSLCLYCFFKKSFTTLMNKVAETETTEYFSRFRNVDWEGCQQKGFWAFIKMMFMKWDLEACVSVPEAVEMEGLDYRETQEMETIQTIHTGSYYKVGEAYNRILEYAKQKNLKVSDGSFEFYLNDPKEVKTEDLQTLVVVPTR